MKLDQTSDPLGLPTQLELFHSREQVKTLEGQFPAAFLTCPGLVLPDLLGDLENSTPADR